uniref:Interleukin-1 n=1 Tax=Mus spicilegus TaxID=10103 RepID=A0A8C6I387_MUSSI
MMAFPPQSCVHVLPPKRNQMRKPNYVHGSPQSLRTYRIHDSQQMVWVLTGNSLTAVPASNNVKPVILSLIACRDTEFQDEKKGNLVFLGIKNRKLCFCCVEMEGKPTLQLKHVDIMNLYKEGKAQKAFPLYHSMEGPTSVFQSVLYPGWFIATSSIEIQTIILTHQWGKFVNTNFYIESEK